MTGQDPNKTKATTEPSVVDATFGAFQGDPVLSVDEERRLSRRARDEDLARKHAPDNA
jgi:hypothetical protein